jgi:hypothetical protein
MASTRTIVAICILAGLWLATPVPGSAQAPVAAPETSGQLRVYLDCPFCDFDFVRTEVTYVDWMRDRADAQVHVLVTSEATGGGGRRYTLEFIGLRDMEGKVDTLEYVADRDATTDVTRRGLTRTLQHGLMRYVAGTPAAERVSITAAAPARAEGAPAAASPDRWNHWVFTIGGSGWTSGESTQSFATLNSNLGANRITEDWKLTFGVSGNYNEQKFTYPVAADRDTTVLAIRRVYSANTLVVRSVNSHISVGGRASVGTSTFGNTRYSVSMAPAVELNLYPYAESTRRRLVVRYGPGLVSQEYREETIFDRTEETRFTHALSAGYATRQPWGDINFSVEGQQFLHDTSLYNVVISGGSTLNLVRGLRLTMYPTYMLIRDQIALPKRGSTPEEILLRQRQIRTAYRYFMNVGLSYRFGSSVQNVVNPRFQGTGGGVIMMF